MHPEPILTETIADIRTVLGADPDRSNVERVVVGLFFTGVKLNTGVIGTCAHSLALDSRDDLLSKLGDGDAVFRETPRPAGERIAEGNGLDARDPARR
jgi:hypothetical protein